MTDESMSKEDVAYFVKTLWEALLAPQWNKDDLIELGKAVYAKTALNKLDQKKFERLFPALVTVAKSLGSHIRTRLIAELEEFSKIQASMAVAEPTPITTTPLAAPAPAVLPPVPVATITPATPPAAPIAIVAAPAAPPATPFTIGTAPAVTSPIALVATPAASAPTQPAHLTLVATSPAPSPPVTIEVTEPWKAASTSMPPTLLEPAAKPEPSNG